MSSSRMNVTRKTKAIRTRVRNAVKYRTSKTISDLAYQLIYRPEALRFSN